jgi:hypothetical protein
MTSILPFQLPLRQQLPLVRGNVDYQVFRQTLQRMSELIRLTDSVLSVAVRVGRGGPPGPAGAHGPGARPLR